VLLAWPILVPIPGRGFLLLQLLLGFAAAALLAYLAARRRSPPRFPEHEALDLLASAWIATLPGFLLTFPLTELWPSLWEFQTRLPWHYEGASVLALGYGLCVGATHLWRLRRTPPKRVAVKPLAVGAERLLFVLITLCCLYALLLKPWWLSKHPGLRAADAHHAGSSSDPWGEPWVERGGLVFSCGPNGRWESRVDVLSGASTGWREGGDDLFVGGHWRGRFRTEPRVSIYTWGPLALMALALSLASSLALVRACPLAQTPRREGLRAGLISLPTLVIACTAAHRLQLGLWLTWLLPQNLSTGLVLGFGAWLPAGWAVFELRRARWLTERGQPPPS